MTATLKQAWRGGRDGRPGWYLVTSFDAAFVEAIKRLPVLDRAWDPEAAGGAWWIALDHEAEILRLLPAFESFLKQGRLL